MMVKVILPMISFLIVLFSCCLWGDQNFHFQLFSVHVHTWIFCLLMATVTTYFLFRVKSSWRIIGLWLVIGSILLYHFWNTATLGDFRQIQSSLFKNTFHLLIVTLEIIWVLLTGYLFLIVLINPSDSKNIN